MLINNFESVNRYPKSKFPTNFDFKFSAEHKRIFFLEKCTQDHIGAKPRTKDAPTFVIEISTPSESVAMTTFDKIY